MSLTKKLAEHIKGVFFGENWTGSNLKNNLDVVDFRMATQSVHSLNTIALLVFHIDYYVSELVKVIDGAPLEAKDKLSLEMPVIDSETAWQQLLDKTWNDAENLIRAVKDMDEMKLWDYMGEEKYYDFYYNIVGTIEHTHYHLGQIVLIKKIIKHLI